MDPAKAVVGVVLEPRSCLLEDWIWRPWSVSAKSLLSDAGLVAGMDTAGNS